MSEKPILFNTYMVRAILDGRKTQTRRAIKPAPFDFTYEDSMPARKPQYQPSDILYVRETWALMNTTPGGHFRPHPVYYYKADDPDIRPIGWDRDAGKWRPSIHMPKAAARIFLKVTNVRAERLRSITEKDAMAEGYPILLSDLGFSATDWFHVTWNDIADESTNWSANPWVWVYEFERIKP